MKILAMYPRTSRAYACVLFIGLSRSLSWRAISLGRKTASRPMLAGSLHDGCRRRAEWVSPICQRQRLTFRRYATTPTASKWEFAVAAAADRKHIFSSEDADIIRKILVCGDGDLSYCAEIAAELDQLGIELYATVLEEEDIHNQVYKYSRSNTGAIASSGHKPMFGVDATTLSKYFGNGDGDDDSEPILFDRIQFNFPHWRGKANNRYNRQLLNDFLQSAVTVLSPRGEIHVALCDGQGG
mmetsp:Transcript_24432/g.58957  ORF Transcript_24432/g.58957 Transcript_24432/m.58957 type:complete len:241 (+) Transcript_24432:56-778(+)